MTPTYETVVYANKLKTSYVALNLLFVGGCLIVFTILLLHWWALMLAPLIVVWVGCIIRTAQARVEIDNRGVTVHGVQRSIFIQKDQYAGFEWKLAAWPYFSTCLAVRRRDGTYVIAWSVPKPYGKADRLGATRLTLEECRSTARRVMDL